MEAAGLLLAASYLLESGLIIVLMCFLYSQVTMGMCRNKVSLVGKVAIVTGGSGGIGMETARGLAERGAKVIIGCRNSQRGKSAVEDIIQTTGNSMVEFKMLDMLNLMSVRTFAEEINQSEVKVDILVNNAGISKGDTAKTLPREANLSPDSLEMVTQTNHLAHFLLTTLLENSLSASGQARVVNVSSVMNLFGSIDIENINHEKYFDGHNAYSNSKLMNILFSKELSRRWQSLGITSYSLHPGFVRTSIFNTSSKRDLFIFLAYFVGKNLVQGAQTSIFLSSETGIEHLSGKHFSDCRMESFLMNRQAEETDLARRLWERSAVLVARK
eukprot:GFUD01007989.1.p1 GENE.GFUD01007989.1~~GFUD01007989.1.p1  ORF type:complete len:329 (+),score=113.32 GFUD01007989.1:66-1052(+)